MGLVQEIRSKGMEFHQKASACSGPKILKCSYKYLNALLTELNKDHCLIQPFQPYTARSGTASTIHFTSAFFTGALDIFAVNVDDKITEPVLDVDSSLIELERTHREAYEKAQGEDPAVNFRKNVLAMIKDSPGRDAIRINPGNYKDVQDLPELKDYKIIPNSDFNLFECELFKYEGAPGPVLLLKDEPEWVKLSTPTQCIKWAKLSTLPQCIKIQNENLVKIKEKVDSLTQHNETLKEVIDEEHNRQKHLVPDYCQEDLKQRIEKDFRAAEQYESCYKAERHGYDIGRKEALKEFKICFLTLMNVFRKWFGLELK